MFTPILAALHFEGLLAGLVFAALALLNFWVWQKGKSTGNLLMLLGFGWLGLCWILFSFETVLLGAANYGWQEFIGAGAILGGFYLSVKPMVAAQIAALQAKAKHIGHKDGGTGTGGGAGTPPPPAAH